MIQKMLKLFSPPFGEAQFQGGVHGIADIQVDDDGALSISDCESDCR